jgi:hypothetical protein
MSKHGVVELLKHIQISFRGKLGVPSKIQKNNSNGRLKNAMTLLAVQAERIAQITAF